MSKVREKFYQGRFLLARRWPWLAPLLYRMIPVETGEQEWAWVDGRGRIGLGKLLEEAQPEVVEGVLAHEAMHLLRDHIRLLGHIPQVDERLLQLRPKDRAMLWNICLDMEVDDDLVEAGLTLPPFYLLDEKGQVVQTFPKHLDPRQFGYPAFLTAPEYLDLILQSSECQDMARSSENDLRQDGGQGQEGEAGQDEGGLSPAELDVIRRAVAEQALAQEQRQPGSVPAGILRWAREVANPQVDWRRVLRSLVRSAIARSSLDRQDYSWRALSRRTLSAFGQRPDPPLHPRLRSPVPEVLVVIDTSGSVTDQELGAALAEVAGVLRAVQAPVTVATGDTRLEELRQVTRVDQVTLRGGGGTDMGRLLAQAAERSGKSFDLAIVLTDGWTPWPKVKPVSCPVLVVTWDRAEAPDWAMVVKIEKGGR